MKLVFKRHRKDEMIMERNQIMKDVKMEKYYDCENIATVLCRLATEKETVKVETLKEVEEVIYHLQEIAENKYNADYYRTFWNILQKITDYNF